MNGMKMLLLPSKKIGKVDREGIKAWAMKTQ